MMPITAPTPADAQRALNRARTMYRRVLAGWACDALMVRRRGLYRAAWPAGPAVVRPKAA